MRETILHLTAKSGAKAGIIIVLTALPLLFAMACAPLESPKTHVASGSENINKSVVLRYMEEVFNKRKLDVLDDIVAKDRIAHNPGERSGRENLKKLLSEKFRQFPEIYADVKRIVAGGDLVVTQSHYTFRKRDRGNDRAPGSEAVADIFRLANGKIVEHWNVIQSPIPEKSVNGNTMFDGGSQYKRMNRKEKTGGDETENKEIVMRYMRDFINGRKIDALDDIMAEDWIAHNPGERNGREALKTLAAQWFRQFPELHADVKRIVADGDLVAIQSHYTVRKRDRGNDRATGSGATVDIFRLENGEIVEHWDVVQRPIPKKSANENTMFDGGSLYNYR